MSNLRTINKSARWEATHHVARTKRVDNTPLPAPRTCRTRAASQEGARREASPFSEVVFDSWEQYERSKKVFLRGVVCERRIRFSRPKQDYMRERLEELGWLFMYNELHRINITLVCEFYSNFSSVNQQTVFLRGKEISFTEDSLHQFLGINVPPPTKEQHAYEQTLADRHMSTLDLTRPIKYHTTFSLNMALFIFTLMVGGRIHLTRIIHDFMYHAAVGPSDQRLPFPLLITRLAAAFDVVPSPEDEYLDIPEKDRDCPFGDGKGEKRKARKGDIVQPPTPIPPPIHEPQAPPQTIAAASSSTAPAADPFKKIMKFPNLLHISSSESKQYTNDEED
ncbi:hypothetical protein PIB30_042704 [Stylosanthes scabra]|uniref:Putative plant transposon protein domain-containing protein n=1 Tax=Stylosanthes scabra TaxID=79078 RepID=A0ABU6XFN4_9FABA|nr:hypothetical protein [Stylosanthes scabra]